jgi:hypothetical protein
MPSFGTLPSGSAAVAWKSYIMSSLMSSFGTLPYSV